MAILPDISKATFIPGAEIDNPYFPLIRNTILSYRADTIDPETGEVETERNDLYTTGETFTVAGVVTTVVHDTLYVNEVIHEDTLDFYAQDTAGNVWYFGEIVINYTYDGDGNFLGTNNNGAWVADDPGNAPGILMPGNPGFGPAYYEEFAPGVAQDESILAGLNLHVDTTYGSYDKVLLNIDSSALFTGIENKYYAFGVGEIMEQDVDPDGTISSVSELYRRGTVGASNSDDGEDTDGVTLNLSDLREGVAVAEVATVETPDEAAFAGDGSTVQVTFVRESSDLANALGAYLYDSATGQILSARILMADLSEASAGDAVAVTVPAGMTLGLFLVAREDEIGVDLADYLGGGLKIVNILNGENANIADKVAPMVTDADGNILPIQPLSALGDEDGTNYLNPAAGLHALSLASTALAGQDASLIGFEDTLTTSPDADGDFNDAIIVVSNSALSATTVDALEDEARGPGNGTPGDDVLLGTRQADTLRGFAGDDEIDGLGGNDRLLGGAGDDELSGGAGQDWLSGGSGENELEGGSGADSFRFLGAASGVGIILDFARADHDRIVIAGAGLSFDGLDSNGDGRLSDADAAVEWGDGALTLDLGTGMEIDVTGIRMLREADLVFLG